MSEAATIEIRPHRGGWKVFEAPGVEPYWTDAGTIQADTLCCPEGREEWTAYADFHPPG